MFLYPVSLLSLLFSLKIWSPCSFSRFAMFLPNFSPKVSGLVVFVLYPCGGGTPIGYGSACQLFLVPHGYELHVCSDPWSPLSSSVLCCWPAEGPPYAAHSARKNSTRSMSGELKVRVVWWGGLVAPSLPCLCRVILAVLICYVPPLEQLCCLLPIVPIFVRGPRTILLYAALTPSSLPRVWFLDGPP